MADAGGGGAEGLTVVLIIGVNQCDGLFAAHFDDEFADAQLLFGGKAELFVWIGANGAIGVIPEVHHTHIDEPVHPFFAEQIFKVRLAQARRDAGQEFVIDAVLQALHRFAEDIFFTAPFVADDFGAFNADERGDVAHAPHLFGQFIGDQLAVGKNLEVAMGMLLQNIEQSLIHEGFAAEDAEETVAGFIGFAEQAIQIFGGNLFLFGGDVHPTALATEVAAIEHGDVEERGKVFTLFHPLLVFLNGPHAAPAEIVGELGHETFVRLKQNSFGHAQVHERLSSSPVSEAQRLFRRLRN